MYALEFQSKIDNGTIVIPIEYKKQLQNNSKVKIIVLTDYDLQSKKVKQFKATSFNTKGFKFDREEANAR